MDERTIETITQKVLAKLGSDDGPGAGSQAGGVRFAVGVSARHVHLSRDDLDVLFGPGYQLQVLRMLEQPDQFAAKETVAVVGPRNAIYGVRVLGPTRPGTQVEISMTDGFSLGIKAPVRDSGKHDGTPGALLVGPAGSVRLERGVIVAARHRNVEPVRAAEVGLQDGQRLSVRVEGGQGRTLTYDNVLVRSGAAHKAEFHLDTDEANAAGLRSGDLVEVLV